MAYSICIDGVYCTAGHVYLRDSLCNSVLQLCFSLSSSLRSCHFTYVYYEKIFYSIFFRLSFSFRIYCVLHCLYIEIFQLFWAHFGFTHPPSKNKAHLCLWSMFIVYIYIHSDSSLLHCLRTERIFIQFWLFCRQFECSLLTSLGKTLPT